MSQASPFELFSPSFIKSGPANVAGVQGEGGELRAFVQSEGRCFALFWLSDQSDAGLMLGYFTSEALLQGQAARFTRAPQTTPALGLKADDADLIRHNNLLQTLPPFHGVFGTAFSGYLLKPDSEAPQSLLMLFYTADYRSELLGIFSPPEALEVMTRHYDNRRKQCLLC